MILGGIFQYFLKIGVLFHMPRTNFLWHGFTKWRDRADLITYNLLFSKLCYRKWFIEATELIESMVESGCKPDVATYDIMINFSCKTGRMEGVLQLLDKMKEEGINPLYGTYSYLLKGILIARGKPEVFRKHIHSWFNKVELIRIWI